MKPCPTTAIRSGTLACLLVVGAMLVAPPLFRRTERAISAIRLKGDWKRHLEGGIATQRTPLAWLEMPACGLEQPILAEDHPRALAGGPALRPVEGVDRCVAIYAHRDQHFAPLRRAHCGDTASVRWRGDRLVHYRVSSIETAVPEAVPLRLTASATPGRVALLTCHPFGYTGPAPERVILWLDPIDIDADVAYDVIALTIGDDDDQEKGEATRPHGV